MDAKTGANTKTAKLTLGDKDWSFPMYQGTIGPEVVDVSKLYGEVGIFTYDPGFTSTASCESKITYIDGDEGVLLYRGYPIDDLAEHGDFLETCYSAAVRRTADRRAEGKFRRPRGPSHHGPRADDPVFSRASAVTLIRWPLWSAASVRFPPSITTPPTSPIRPSA